MSWTTTQAIPTPENLERVLLCWSDQDSEWPSSHTEELKLEDTSYSENVMVFSSRKLNETLRENAALHDRIDALEWLREVEEVRTTMCEWHPYFMTEAERPGVETLDNAEAEYEAILAAARAAVES